MSAVVHYVPVPSERWTAVCGVNNQVRKPCTDDLDAVTCKRCARIGRYAASKVEAEVEAVLNEADFGELAPPIPPGSEPVEDERFDFLVNWHIDNIIASGGCPGPRVAHGCVHFGLVTAPV